MALATSARPGPGKETKALPTGNDFPIDSRQRSRQKPRLIKVTDRVYCANGYSVSNVLYVVTNTSVVVIDTAETRSAAKASLDDFRKVCRLPVSYIIYTHFHGDHVRGADIFKNSGTKVIAQARLPEELAKKNLVLFQTERANAIQVKSVLPKKLSIANCDDREAGYLAPDITFDEQYDFEEGGVRFELYHTQGETVDHLMVWLPAEEALFPGDLFYNSFPMLSNPLKPDRPVLAWANSLQRMRTFHPKYLVPSHSTPLQGAEIVESALANYEKAIRFVHDHTIRGINEGIPLAELRERIRLPEELAGLPYLQERYGKVEWAVTGIFRQYTGWYDFNSTHLSPSNESDVCAVLLEIAGGVQPVLERARKALLDGANQMALELTDIVLAARRSSTAAEDIRVEALTRLAASARNGVERNIYRSAARAHRQNLTRSRSFIEKTSEEFESHSVTLPGAGVRAEEPGWPGIIHKTSDTGTQAELTSPDQGAVDSKAQVQLSALNEWYDHRMFDDWHQPVHDFANYGYWRRRTRTYRAACENLMEELLAFLPEKHGNIIDIACGKGATTAYLLKYYKPQNVFGINISRRQLERCRLNAPGCKFLLMDATNLKFEDEEFDNIICVEAAFHFDTREKFLREACRVLKPGGRLVLSDVIRSREEAPTALVPVENFISNIGEYRDLYQRVGFTNIQIVDATNECWTEFFRRAYAWWHRQYLTHRISRAVFKSYTEFLLWKKKVIRSYLLVSAQKPETAIGRGS